MNRMDFIRASERAVKIPRTEKLPKKEKKEGASRKCHQLVWGGRKVRGGKKRPRLSLSFSRFSYEAKKKRGRKKKKGKRKKNKPNAPSHQDFPSLTIKW